MTENIVLATGVTMLSLHYPVDTAHRIAMLNHMARGRIYLGDWILVTPHRFAASRYRLRHHGRGPGATEAALG